MILLLAGAGVAAVSFVAGYLVGNGLKFQEVAQAVKKRIETKQEDAKAQFIDPVPFHEKFTTAESIDDIFT